MKDYTIGRFRSALAPGVRLEQTIKYVGISIRISNNFRIASRSLKHFVLKNVAPDSS